MYNLLGSFFYFTLIFILLLYGLGTVIMYVGNHPSHGGCSSSSSSSSRGIVVVIKIKQVF